jgi:hypothetical protein
MTIVIARALAASLLLSAAPVLAGPTPAPPRPSVAGAEAAGERIEIVLVRPPFLYSGTFRAASDAGTVHDGGPARDEPGLDTPESPMERTLTGERGTIRLRVESGHKAAPKPVHDFGRWTLVGGTGAYAGLRGEGTYTVTDGGRSDERSLDLELHTLVGVVRRTGR